jgi:hypothetical protein
MKYDIVLVADREKAAKCGHDEQNPRWEKNIGRYRVQKWDKGLSEEIKVDQHPKFQQPEKTF